MELLPNILNTNCYITELKDGECPRLENNTVGTCQEECQMDSNCTGSAKCCFNGCGHTCQEPGKYDNFLKYGRQHWYLFIWLVKW
jgi:hypothetical protein